MDIRGRWRSWRGCLALPSAVRRRGSDRSQTPSPAPCWAAGYDQYDGVALAYALHQTWYTEYIPEITSNRAIPYPDHSPTRIKGNYGAKMDHGSGLPPIRGNACADSSINPWRAGVAARLFCIKCNGVCMHRGAIAFIVATHASGPDDGFCSARRCASPALSLSTCTTATLLSTIKSRFRRWLAAVCLASLRPPVDRFSQ